MCSSSELRDEEKYRISMKSGGLVETHQSLPSLVMEKARVHQNLCPVPISNFQGNPSPKRDRE